MLNPLSAQKSKVQSESDFMSARTSPSDFAAPYYFSISPTCGFAFGVFSCGVYSTSGT